MIRLYVTAEQTWTAGMTLSLPEAAAHHWTRVLGTTMNMDGTALYECVAVLFLAQLLGADLTIVQQLLVLFLALATSTGMAGIPAASLVAIALILDRVGLPAEALGLLLITDRPLDMCRTAVNVWSDSVAARLVAYYAKTDSPAMAQTVTQAPTNVESSQ